MSPPLPLSVRKSRQASQRIRDWHACDVKAISCARRYAEHVFCRLVDEYARHNEVIAEFGLPTVRSIITYSSKEQLLEALAGRFAPGDKVGRQDLALNQPLLTLRHPRRVSHLAYFGAGAKS
ncbi:hypothetical protein [Mesorhizobium erdmanii]|uniref:hypothetical protein n=1 Tax=Mesorhizobium erdmanii TaxID=1777866 RepID=UPI0012B5E9AC|nr:hypothetical protein [Mesorhizobium erdmanii]